MLWEFKEKEHTRDVMRDKGMTLFTSLNAMTELKILLAVVD